MLVLRKQVTTIWKAIGNQQSVDFLTGVLTSSGLKLSMSPTSLLPLAIMAKRRMSPIGVHLTPSAIPNLICAARYHTPVILDKLWKKCVLVHRCYGLIFCTMELHIGVVPYSRMAGPQKGAVYGQKLKVSGQWT